MSNSTTLLDLISSTQANKEAVANALFDASSPATLWGRRASTTAGLTWGYYGGSYYVNGAVNSVANGTLTLNASATNYIYANAATGAVSVNTSGVPAGAVPLYSVVTGTTTVSSYTDLRSFQPSAIGGAGSAGLAGGAVQTAAYTFAGSDKGLTLVMNSATAVTQQLPTGTGTSGSFASGWYGATENIGAGNMTLTVASGASLDGVVNGTLVLRQNSGCNYFTDGTNWYTMRGVSAGQLQYLGDVSVTPGAGIDQYALVYNNSTGKWIAKNISSGGTTTAPVGFVTYMNSTFVASQTLLKAVVPMAVTLPLNLAQSYAKCDVAPTNAVSCPIQQNGTAIGSVNFAAGATSGTFTFTSPISILPGDVLTVLAPSTADATFAGAAISLLASAPATAGNTTLASMTDVSIASPTNGQVLVYNSTTGQWNNVTLGTMSTQNANAVAITGGTADGLALGNTTPAGAKVTTLAASGATTLNGQATLSYANPRFYVNDSSGTNGAGVSFQNAGTTLWQFLSTSSSGTFSLGRYSGGTQVDSPLTVSSAGLVTMADGATVSGAFTANGTVTLGQTGNTVTVQGSMSIGAAATSSKGVELGGQSGTAASAFIDLHSSGNAIDYDSRIIATGGTTTAGQGAVQVIAGGGITLSGSVTASGLLAANSGINALGTVNIGDVTTPNGGFQITPGLGGSINHLKPASGGQFDINDIPSASTGSSLFRFHRSTTAATVQVIYYRGDGTTSADHSFTSGGTAGASAASAALCSSGGTVGIGGSPVSTRTLTVYGDTSISGVLTPKSYTKATVPTASSYTAGVIYVTDATGGAALAVSNGTNWISQITGAAI